MLQPFPVSPVPTNTIRVARAALRNQNSCLQLRDYLGTVFDNEMFAPLFPERGQPAAAPWRLALVTILQFSEGLSDRDAADAVRSRIDWKYLLGLELGDPGFDYSILSRFLLFLFCLRFKQDPNLTLFRVASVPPFSLPPPPAAIQKLSHARPFGAPRTRMFFRVSGDEVDFPAGLEDPSSLFSFPSLCPGVGQIKPPKWAKSSCQTHKGPFCGFEAGCSRPRAAPSRHLRQIRRGPVSPRDIQPGFVEFVLGTSYGRGMARHRSASSLVNKLPAKHFQMKTYPQRTLRRRAGIPRNDSLHKHR